MSIVTRPLAGQKNGEQIKKHNKLKKWFCYQGTSPEISPGLSVDVSVNFFNGMNNDRCGVKNGATGQTHVDASKTIWRIKLKLVR